MRAGWIRAALTAVALAITPGSAAAFPYTGSPATPDPAAALASLNAYRGAGGLPAVADTLAPWNDACAKHVAYEQSNGVLTHVENPGAPGYTPEGAWAGTHSVLTTQRGNPTAWDGAVYHRLGVLQPRLRHTGWAVGTSSYSCLVEQGGDANGSAVEDSAATRSAAVVVYPWPSDGATSVPRTFANNESPAPSADAGGDTSLGYLLSLQVNGPWPVSGGVSVDVTEAHLTSAGGELPLAISDQDAVNHLYLSGGAGLFPTEPLAADTTYRVSVAGVIHARDFSSPGAPTTDYPLQAQWAFSTGTTVTGATPVPTPSPSPAPAPGTPSPPVVCVRAPCPGPGGPGDPAPPQGTSSAGIDATPARQSRKTVLRRGVLVQGTSAAADRLVLSLAAGSRSERRRLRLPTTLGTRVLGVPGGAWSARLRLSSRARRALRRSSRAVHLTLLVRGAAGSSMRRTITLR